MSLLRSAATVGSITLISRFFGFARDVMMANVIGTGLVAQAFVVAFRFPNLFRTLFAEGAFNSAFVPLFRQEARSGRCRERRTICRRSFVGALCLAPRLYGSRRHRHADLHLPDRFRL